MFAMNNTMMGSHMCITPFQCVNAPTLDILLLKESSCCKQLAMFDHLKTGSHIFDEATETVRCTNFSLRVIGQEEPMGINIDGECCAITPITVERQMHSLRFVHT